MSEALKTIDRSLLHRLSGQASAAGRLRANHNLHPRLSDPVQRMCNALQPHSYVRPHRHTRDERWELFVALEGAVAVLIFDEQGILLERLELRAGGPIYGVEIASGVWHSLVCLAPDTVVFEVKPGPYEPSDDKQFAAWAPAEGEQSAAAFVDWMQRARPGDRWT